jgi:hypothetical protein
MVPPPVNPSQPLPSLGCFGLPRGRSSTGRPCAAQGPQERCGLRRLAIRRCHRPRWRRLCLPWARLLGARAPCLLGLGPCMLHPAVSASCERLLGAPGLSLVAQCLASLNEQMASTALPRWHEPHGRPLSRTLVPGLQRLLQASARLRATSARPQASPGSRPAPACPSQGLRWRPRLLSLGLSFLSGEHARSARRHHRLQAEPLLESDTLACPRQERLCGCRKGARGGLAAPPRGAGLAPWPAHAPRGWHACHEGMVCLRDSDRRGRTGGKATTIMLLGGRGRMIVHVRSVAYRARAS